MVRFYDPGDGSVRYGGVDLRDATLHSLRERIVVVPQEGFLFGGTIRDNLLIARPAPPTPTSSPRSTRSTSADASPRSHHGLDTEVHERGANFSAGERQLVSLVRAALADPAVVVLDEATSSLDPGTELLVEHALERLMEGRTVIVIAHRLSTAERADLVAVVQGGRFVEIGTHQALVHAAATTRRSTRRGPDDAGMRRCAPFRWSLWQRSVIRVQSGTRRSRMSRWSPATGNRRTSPPTSVRLADRLIISIQRRGLQSDRDNAEPFALGSPNYSCSRRSNEGGATLSTALDAVAAEVGLESEARAGLEQFRAV